MLDHSKIMFDVNTDDKVGEIIIWAIMVLPGRFRPPGGLTPRWSRGETIFHCRETERD